MPPLPWTSFSPPFSDGSVTAFYTVLMEGDDLDDPVAEEVRSILDGHIMLSRKLAAANHFPAIDVLASKSRLMPQVASQEHRSCAGRVITWMATYAENELLLRVGEYQAGTDPDLDLALEKRPEINRFLQQDMDENETFESTLEKLRRLAG